MEIQPKLPTTKGPSETFVGEWHWHGAAPDHFMTHISITEGLSEGQQGPETEWGDHIPDAEYGSK